MHIPAYPSRPHKSGQARIRIQGKDVWLGKWNTPESRVKYARIVAEYSVSGHLKPTSEPTRTTVAELLDAFRCWAESRYVKNGAPTTEIQLYRMATEPVLELYADIAADDFGPLALMACRSWLVARGYCRTKINEHLGRIRRVFKWGVSREMVSEGTWTALRSVEGLRRGEAHDRPKVTCVPADAVTAIKDHVLPPVWAMVQLQHCTGMRPGEAVLMRTCDVHAEHELIPLALRGKCWLYIPPSHKTEHHGKQRLVFLGPQAQAILQAWLRPDAPERPLFSPAEGMEFSRAQRRAARKTPGTSKYVRKAEPKRKPRDSYTVSAYAHAIEKACAKADVAVWGPNRLRHNAGTLLRERYGIETARVILGHANLSTTEIYAEADRTKAALAMTEMG